MQNRNENQSKTIKKKDAKQIKYRGPWPLLISFMIYILWLGATFFLEGRILTLKRPEAVIDRLIYTIVANIIIGIVIAFLFLRQYVSDRYISLKQMGFSDYKKTIATILIGGILGFIFYILQNPPSMNPVVITNAYAQVLSVSIAEIVVCWVVVGNTVESYLKSYNKYMIITIAIIISSVAFGVYHFGHSPPFNTVNMVLLLTLIGLITGLFFFISRNIYGTIAFHNFLGIIGVTKSLEKADKLSSYTEIQIPLIMTAFIAILVLILSFKYILEPINEEGD
jgi:hypothetical protein